MPKLFSLSKIIMEDPKNKGDEMLIEQGVVFDATVEQAHQFDGLGSARPATNAEIAAAKESAKIADGTMFLAPAPSDSVLTEEPETTSIATGDPRALPKGKSA